MSLSAVTLIGSIANWALLACLLGGVLATFIIVQATDIKEEHWAEQRKHSNERIAELSVQAEALKKDTAEATARAVEAQLALEKFKAPRSLTVAQKKVISDKLAKFAGMPFDFSVNPQPEPQALMAQIGFGAPRGKMELAIEGRYRRHSCDGPWWRPASRYYDFVRWFGG